MTLLIKCKICDILYEVENLAECPKCKNTQLFIAAKYPTLDEKTEENQVQVNQRPVPTA